MDCLYKYVTNDERFKWILVQNGINSCFWKDGICVECCQQFIIYTNGLNQIIKDIQNAIRYNYHGKRQLFRLELQFTQIILKQNPMFIHCILLQTNIRFISSVFHTFFITYLKEIDLNDLIFNKKLYTLHTIALKGNMVQCIDFMNNCHGIEYSLTVLSNIVCGLLMRMKTSHFYSFLVNRNECFQSFAIIIKEFMEQYLELPHIKLLWKWKFGINRKFKLNRNLIQNVNI